VSSLLPRDKPGMKHEDGGRCTSAGRYCLRDPLTDLFYPCAKSYSSRDSYGDLHTDCYFGRGVIQLSYNYNYGQLQQWLMEQGLDVDLLGEPNLLLTHRKPPLAFLASLWFYMTPQPPKPAMHDIVMG